MSGQAVTDVGEYKRIDGKLVRSKIPELIRKDGGTPVVTILTDDAEYEQALLEKLAEEVREVQDTKSEVNLVYELADLMQVIKDLLHLKDISLDQVFVAMEEKRLTKGDFRARMFLDKIST